MEVWKNIPIEELDKYEISDLGNIRNKKTGRVLKVCVHRDGYIFFRAFTKDKTKRNYYIHRLVLISFTGNMEGFEVNHINHNIKDNKLVNLEWMSKQENIRKKRDYIKEQIKNLYESKNFNDLEDFYNKVMLL